MAEPMTIFSEIFYEIAALLAVAAVIAGLGLRLRQPLIVSFIAVGLLVGPAGLDWVSSADQVDLLSKLGIALLLFVVGLKLDLHLIRTTGPVALATGLGQVLFTSVFGFLLGLALGLPPVAALYLAVALTFSSTIIIVKLLSDKKEIDSLHGRIAVGFLIVQDLAVVLVMIALTAFGAGTGTGRPSLELALVLAKGAGYLCLIAVAMRWIFPRLLPQVARSQELLILVAIAWAIALAALGDGLGFSKEVGAFLAGVALASTPFRDAIGARLAPLRDFLLLFFFIDLGSMLELDLLGGQLAPALIFSLFVLVGNPLIVMVIMGWMGYRKRTGFLAGLTVAQISEFSLILGALGVSLGHIQGEMLGLITLVGLITIGLSTYLILYSHPLYNRLAPWLGIFERRRPYRESAEESGPLPDHIDVILFGLGRYGRNIAENLISRGKKVLAVDFDPQVVAAGTEACPVCYGDAEDPELLGHLPLRRARWVVNAIPGAEANLTLLKALRDQGYSGKVVLTAHNQREADSYRQAGADKVLWPFVDAAEQAVDYLSAAREELSAQAPWPVTLEEVKLRPDSAASGKRIGELALRSRTGVSVVAVDRAGRSHYDPEADFPLFPGDRLVLLGSEGGMAQARRLLEERRGTEEEERTFQLAQLCLRDDSAWAGKSLAALDLRRRLGISVMGIERGGQRLLSPQPREVLEPGDTLLVIGHPEAIRACERQEGA